MSSDSLAYFRKNRGSELAKLAEAHLQHDLSESDQAILHKAAGEFTTYALIGTALGLSLGVIAAMRVRAARTAMWTAFKSTEHPTHVTFAGGRVEPLPDLSPYLKPQRIGTVATYFLFSAGGLFVGGEAGALTGSLVAGRTITRDPDASDRISKAFMRFRADALRAEAKRLDEGRVVVDRFA
ncbi:hypothetical protein EJ06DRAFT_539039 [Trichodelitschia bisporula]|uniref:Uncharacterized protein n=1 Tax=Trichodelitschia bisporula TaxID=703511 RepID=A0A6G1HQ49_9PEZI|nr:hypothetical protein EJ06DRAFT_539039 [Trichodelitschia bisporula]